MSLAARAIPGGWTERELTLAGRMFPLLIPAAPDDVLFHLEEHPEPSQGLGADPYWAKLWPTSLHLAETILRHPWPSGLTAIELGCGIGLAGIAAAARGMTTTFSDYNPIAVELALENARRCGLANLSGQVLDWRSPPMQKYDVILASDVIYDRMLHVPLMDTIEALAKPQTTIWIGDGGRSATEDFVYLALERWEIELLDVTGERVASLHLGEYRQMVIRLR